MRPECVHTCAFVASDRLSPSRHRRVARERTIYPWVEGSLGGWHCQMSWGWSPAIPLNPSPFLRVSAFRYGTGQVCKPMTSSFKGLGKVGPLVSCEGCSCVVCAQSRLQHSILYDLVWYGRHLKLRDRTANFGNLLNQTG